MRAEGDAAVRRFTTQFGGASLDDLRVSAAEFREARAALSAEQIAALERAVANVARFHEAQVSAPLVVETMPGVRCERITRPIDSVGLYVPAGSAPLPSTAIMLAVPARIAGCKARAIASSPGPDGKLHAAVLVAAELCGVDTVYKMGGAQAIAALAFGTRIRPQGRQDLRARQRLGHGRQADRRRAIPPAPPSTCPRVRPKCWSSPTIPPMRASSPRTCWRRPNTTPSRR